MSGSALTVLMQEKEVFYILKFPGNSLFFNFRLYQENYVCAPVVDFGKRNMVFIGLILNRLEG